jgi:hypothetical protein
VRLFSIAYRRSKHVGIEAVPHHNQCDLSREGVNRVDDMHSSSISPCQRRPDGETLPNRQQEDLVQLEIAAGVVLLVGATLIAFAVTFSYVLAVISPF